LHWGLPSSQDLGYSHSGRVVLSHHIPAAASIESPTCNSKPLLAS
jgi:hypothetical protein